MERLTKRESANVGGREYVLCNYKKEDCNDSCMYGTDCKWKHKALLKLKEYEDAEEQGLLLRLPCKVGDTVYLYQCKKIWERKVNAFSVSSNNKLMVHMQDCEKDNCTFPIDKFGTTVFLTREQAEKKLNEQKEL